MKIRNCLAGAVLLLFCRGAAGAAETAQAAPVKSFFEQRCFECHDADTAKGGLDLTSLSPNLSDPATFARWVKVHDRIEAGEMPPKKKPRPQASEIAPVLQWMSDRLIDTEKSERPSGRATLRRLTRIEYENTIRDLLDLPGLPIREELPPDGSLSGFNKVSEALDISHVQMAKYMEVAEKTLNLAVATRPDQPGTIKHRFYPAGQSGFSMGLLSGNAVMLKDKTRDPVFPLIEERPDKGDNRQYRRDVFDPSKSAVGTFRPSEAGSNLGFKKLDLPASGHYKIRLSVWSFGWDKGQVVPSKRTQAVGISKNDGLIAYFDAPSLKSREYERDVWLDRSDVLMFNAASLEHGGVGNARAAGYEGPGVAIDWLEVEGPLNPTWPPASHTRLFGNLPITKFEKSNSSGANAPQRPDSGPVRRSGQPRPVRKHDTAEVIWTVKSQNPADDSRRLLKTFLPRAFRRPVQGEEVERYGGIVSERLAAGDCFEDAMKMAYQAALCSPEFLFHIEFPDRLDDYAIASRLSYFLWNTMPDEELATLAARGDLHAGGDILRRQTERMLDDPRSDQFIADFLNQWLALDQIAENTPDKMLYPEFKPYMQDCMVEETRSFFRQLIRSNLGVSNLVDSNFAMLNTELGALYGIPNAPAGDTCSRMQLPAGSHRGGLLTQASVLKVTANGTVTSPVKRGAWIMDRLLGKRPDPPPPSVVAIDPDLRGTTTIREQLDKHRSDASCAVCHSKIDPPGFALESFDVIGRWRDHYRSKEIGQDVDSKVGENHVPVRYKLGPPVDCTGQTADGIPFKDIDEFKVILLKDQRQLARNLLSRLALYATGSMVGFSDRRAIEKILDTCAVVNRADGSPPQVYPVRSLVEELVASELFLTK
jgi:mono/diheme cytochrome c family protein